MKKALVVTFVMALALAFAAPTSAEPARASSASAYGLNATGILDLGPIAPTSASAPPDTSREAPPREVLLEVPLQPIAGDATVGSVSEAHTADDISSKMKRRNPDDAIENPVTLQGANASGFASTDGLSIIVQGVDLDPLTDELELLSLVAAEAIDTEVMVKCVNNRPVWDAGYNEVEAAVAGQDVELVDEVVRTVLDLLGAADPNGGGVLPANVLDVDRAVTNINDDGTLSSGTTGFIDGLRIDSDLLDLHIVISHAEASMPTPCGIEPPKPTGPGPIAQDRPDRLPATGGEMGTLPMMAFGVLGGAVLLRRPIVRSYRRAS